MGGGVAGCLCSSGGDVGGGVAAPGNRSSRNKSKENSGLSDMSTTTSNNDCCKQYDEGAMYSYYHDPELLLQIQCSGDESGVGNAGIDSKDICCVVKIYFPPSVLDMIQELGSVA
eukprot:3846686-Ditylum_brightwellii.AAC.1